MKIAIVTPRFPIIGEAFIMDQITGLIDLGHDVHIIAGSNPNEPMVHENVKKYKLDKITYYYHPPVNKIKRYFIGLGIILKWIFIKPVPVLKSLNFFKYKMHALSLNLLFNVRPFLEHKYDIVHCHFGPTGIQFLFLKAFFNIPMVVTFHGVDYTGYLHNLPKDFYKGMFEKVDKVITASNYSATKLKLLFCPPEKLFVLPYGINITNYKFIPRSNSNGKINVTTVARLVEKKGYPTSLKAIKKVSGNHPLIYSIIGGGQTEEIV